jgi:hypothetical protein
MASFAETFADIDDPNVMSRAACFLRTRARN